MSDSEHQSNVATDFHVHASKRHGRKCQSNLIDFTEGKLRQAAKRATSPKVRNNVMTLLKSYCAGRVAIAWSNGQPLFHQVQVPKKVSSTQG